mgnify:CR=1 FL=1
MKQNETKNMQNKGMLPYGPFVRAGTNCSRFAAKVIKASAPPLMKKIRLTYPFCISPSPKRNVSICNRNFYFTDKKGCEKIKRNILAGYFKSIERR